MGNDEQIRRLTQARDAVRAERDAANRSLIDVANEVGHILNDTLLDEPKTELGKQARVVIEDMRHVCNQRDLARSKYDKLDVHMTLVRNALVAAGMDGVEPEEQIRLLAEQRDQARAAAKIETHIVPKATVAVPFTMKESRHLGAATDAARQLCAAFGIKLASGIECDATAMELRVTWEPCEGKTDAQISEAIRRSIQDAFSKVIMTLVDELRAGAAAPNVEGRMLRAADRIEHLEAIERAARAGASARGHHPGCAFFNYRYRDCYGKEKQPQDCNCGHDALVLALTSEAGGDAAPKVCLSEASPGTSQASGVRGHARDR